MTKLAATAERYSLKYVNLLEMSPESQLSLLNARFELAGESVSHKGFRLRAERHGGGVITIIELSTGAVVQLPDGNHAGLLFNVDSIRETIATDSPNEVLDDPYRHLDRLHETCKGTFFGLLTDETISSLGPMWNNEDLH